MRRFIQPVAPINGGFCVVCRNPDCGKEFRSFDPIRYRELVFCRKQCKKDWIDNKEAEHEAKKRAEKALELERWEAEQAEKRRRAALKETGQGAVYWSYRERAEQKGRAFELTPETFVAITQRACAYCGIEPQRSTKGFVWNGVDRIDNRLGYIEGNVCPCCTTCNMAKKDMPREQFLAWIQRVHAHLFSR